MAKKPERDIIVWIFKNFINSFKPRKFFGELKGTDHFGNKYFEIPAGKNRAKSSRYFEPIGKEDNFDQELPAEWEAWLRGRRSTPPTDEEVKKNYQLSLEKKKKALEIEQKFKVQKAEQAEHLTEDNKKKHFPEYPEYERIPGEKSPWYGKKQN